MELAPLVEEDGDAVAEFVVWNGIEKSDQVIIDEREVCVCPQDMIEGCPTGP